MLSLRRISHSASLRATGSEIAACACVASEAFCLRTSSMMFSSTSLSACEVVDVAATAAGATCLRGDGRAACWRVAGASTGGAGAGAAGAVATGAAVFAGGFAVVFAAYSQSSWGRRCGRSAAASAVELSAWPRPPQGGRTARSPAPGSWPVRSTAMGLRGRKGSRLSSAAANHSIALALDLFD